MAENEEKEKVHNRINHKFESIGDVLKRMAQGDPVMEKIMEDVEKRKSSRSVFIPD